MIHFLFFSLIFLSRSPVAIKDVLSFYLFVQFCSSDKVDNFQKINGLVMTMMLTIVMAKVMIRVVEVVLHFFFLSVFSFTDTDDSQGSRGREGSIFYSTLPLPPAHEHIGIYFATLSVRWLSHISNCTACFYQTATRWDLPPYRIIIWLIDDVMLIFLSLLVDLIQGFCYSCLTLETCIDYHPCITSEPTNQVC